MADRSKAAHCSLGDEGDACQSKNVLNRQVPDVRILLLPQIDEVAHGNRGDNSIYTDAFCRELRENGAHIVGDYLYTDAPTCNLNRSTSYRSNTLENWICAISPNL